MDKVSTKSRNVTDEKVVSASSNRADMNIQVTTHISNSQSEDSLDKTNRPHLEFNLDPVKGEIDQVFTVAADSEQEGQSEGQSKMEGQSEGQSKKKGQSKVQFESQSDIQSDVQPYIQNGDTFGDNSIIPKTTSLSSQTERRSLWKRLRRLLSCAGLRSRGASQPTNDILDAFIHYNNGPRQNRKPQGRGLCVIFTLFTGQSILGDGYIKDKERFQRFFANILKYNVFCDGDKYENVTRQQLLDTMTEIQNEIASKAKLHQKTYYDRFVFIILTHGTQDGLKTCATKDGRSDEIREIPVVPHCDKKSCCDNKTCCSHCNICKQTSTKTRNEIVYTRTEEICDMLKHDKVPELKDKPKLFLIQACRGEGTIRSASTSNHSNLCNVDVEQLNLRTDLPIDSDQIVFYASTPEYKAFVEKDHSWFLKTTLDVFQRHYATKHVEDMMTVVNLALADRTGNEEIENEAGDIIDIQQANQMPCKHSTLRKQFFL